MLKFYGFKDGVNKSEIFIIDEKEFYFIARLLQELNRFKHSMSIQWRIQDFWKGVSAFGKSAAQFELKTKKNFF